MSETVDSDRLADLHREIDECVVCRGAGFCIGKPTSIRRGDSSATVMAIGIAPGAAAKRRQMAFAGHSFTRLQKWFAGAGFPSSESQLRSALYLTALNKCLVTPDSAANRRGLWIRCQQFLWRQIAIIQPRLILVLGSEPTSLLLGKPKGRFGDLVGSSWTTEDIFGSDLFPRASTTSKWLVLPHPSGLNRMANDPERQNVIAIVLRQHLLEIGFRLPSTQEDE